MKLVVIESPFGTNPDGSRADAQTVERNVRYLRACIADCFRRGEAPFASHGLYPGALNDHDPADRALGMEAGFLWGDHAETRAVYVDFGITPGMQRALDRMNERTALQHVEQRRVPPDLLARHLHGLS